MASFRQNILREIATLPGEPESFTKNKLERDPENATLMGGVLATFQDLENIIAEEGDIRDRATTLREFTRLPAALEPFVNDDFI